MSLALTLAYCYGLVVKEKIEVPGVVFILNRCPDSSWRRS